MIAVFVYICLFFFKQKTAYEMRISDWSSDVCSSDLDAGAQSAIGRHADIQRIAVRTLRDGWMLAHPVTSEHVNPGRFRARYQRFGNGRAARTASAQRSHVAAKRLSEIGRAHV